jgi:plastocyanin
MSRRVAIGLAALGSLLISAGPAAAATDVDAAGNPFTGGLAFDPANVRVVAGDVVSWTNTDFLVPHTSTEDHQLWELSGSYGPPGTTGYGPGETVARRFAAGTWSYFCEIHPDAMKGTVAVPVKLAVRKPARRRGARARLRVIAVWGAEKLPAGQVFDVQRRVKGRWKTVRNGTGRLRGSFGAKAGQTLRFRARVRRTTAPTASSGYSPVARITAR